MHVNRDPVECFCREATKTGAQVTRLRDWDSAADEVVRIVQDIVADGRVAAPGLPEWFSQVLTDHGLSLRRQVGDVRSAADRISVGFNMAHAGVAETGSAVCFCMDENERLASMLCVDHVVALTASSIVATLGDLAPVLERQFGSGAGYVAMISGPSRTADIERELTIGVHGPQRVHLLVIHEETP